MDYKIINFYEFFPIADLAEAKQRFEAPARELGLKGTILLAPEGINAGLAGSSEAVDSYVAFLRTIKELADTPVKTSWGATEPYRKLLVRAKAQILTFPKDIELSVDEIKATPHKTPEEWRALLPRVGQDVIMLDTRNDYECSYGTFRGAEQLGTQSFGDFPSRFLERYGQAKDKTILMFCTGGIRCEKAVAFAQKEGFTNVFKLDGGIISYFEQCGGEGWDGTCFVFDHRWAIKPELEEAPEAARPEA